MESNTTDNNTTDMGEQNPIREIQQEVSSHKKAPEQVKEEPQAPPAKRTKSAVAQDILLAISEYKKLAASSDPSEQYYAKVIIDEFNKKLQEPDKSGKTKGYFSQIDDFEVNDEAIKQMKVPAIQEKVKSSANAVWLAIYHKDVHEKAKNLSLVTPKEIWPIIDKISTKIGELFGELKDAGDN